MPSDPNRPQLDSPPSKAVPPTSPDVRTPGSSVLLGNFRSFLLSSQWQLRLWINDRKKADMHWKLSILGAVIVFALLAASNIDLPGIYYDELIQVTPALRFVKGSSVQSQTFGAGLFIGIHGHRIPLMTMGYIGAVKTVAFVPLAAAVDLSPRSIRYFTILIGALALVAISAFARRLLGPAAAILGIILLAIDPSYLIYCRTDYGPTVFMMALKGVALWQLIVWWQTRSSWSLYVAAFAMGLGVYDKTNFLWIVIALAGAALLIVPQFLARLRRWEVMLAGCLFLIGCLPLITYNLHWPPPTWTALESHNNLSNDETGAPRSLGELEHRLMRRTRVLTGLFTAKKVWYVRDSPAPLVVLMPVVALTASVITLICFAVPRLRRRWRREMLLLLTTSLVILLAAVTPGAHENHHLILAYPFPHLLVAAVVVRCARLSYRMRTPLGAIAAAAVLLVGAAGPATASLLRYRQVLVQLQKTGGTGDWSDGIYLLDSWLETHDPGQPVVAVDWGIEQPLAALSQGRLRCVELYHIHDAGVFQHFFDQPGTRYVLHPPTDTNFPVARDLFLKAARDRGFQIHSVKTITDRMARPILLVYVLSPTVSDDPFSERRVDYPYGQEHQSDKSPEK